MTESSAHGRPENPLGISGDSTERRQAEEHGPASQNLLRAISVIQSEFIAELEPKVFFEHLLTELLSLSKSAYGFIGEILWTNEGKPYLRTQAISNIAWNEETTALYKRDAPNLEFYNLDTLFGAVITSGKPVLANDPGTDPRRSGLPQGHPALNAFLGLPFYRGTKLWWKPPWRQFSFGDGGIRSTGRSLCRQLRQNPSHSSYVPYHHRTGSPTG